VGVARRGEMPAVRAAFNRIAPTASRACEQLLEFFRFRPS
jgi:hypothetical protein